MVVKVTEVNAQILATYIASSYAFQALKIAQNDFCMNSMFLLLLISWSIDLKVFFCEQIEDLSAQSTGQTGLSDTGTQTTNSTASQIPETRAQATNAPDRAT